MRLTLRVIDAAGDIKAEAEGQDEAVLVYRATYAEGDRLVLMSSEPGHVSLAVGAGVPPAAVYLQDTTFAFAVPFAEKRKAYAPQAFAGDLHRLQVRRIQGAEITAYRNLALNPLDDHGNDGLFPQAKANAETRGEAAFAARNAIDGEKANTNHGFWPFTSWGINRNPDAALTVHFGRPVEVDEVVLYLRADFPHDAWWQQASLTFSDGTSLCVALIKSAEAQKFIFARKTIEWLTLHSLIKADDPSPYPALSQIEVWGRDVGPV